MKLSRNLADVPNEIGLAHELIHVHHFVVLGIHLTNPNLTTPELENLAIFGNTSGSTDTTGGFIGTSSCFPAYTENGIRSQLGVDSRLRS